MSRNEADILNGFGIETPNGGGGGGGTTTPPVTGQTGTGTPTRDTNNDIFGTCWTALNTSSTRVLEVRWIDPRTPEGSDIEEAASLGPGQILAICSEFSPFSENDFRGELIFTQCRSNGTPITCNPSLNASDCEDLCVDRTPPPPPPPPPSNNVCLCDIDERTRELAQPFGVCSSGCGERAGNRCTTDSDCREPTSSPKTITVSGPLLFNQEPGGIITGNTLWDISNGVLVGAGETFIITQRDSINFNIEIGRSFRVIATPQTGYRFVRWLNNGQPFNITVTELTLPTGPQYTSIITVQANVDYNITAQFERIISQTLTVRSQVGGSVTGTIPPSIGAPIGVNVVSGNTINYTNVSLNENASLTATATQGYEFGGWEITNGLITEPLNPVLTYTISPTDRGTPIVITARFNLLPVLKTLTVSANPTNGGSAVILDQSTGRPLGQTTISVNEGTKLVVRAIAAEGFEFINWTRRGNTASFNVASQFEVTLNEDYDLIANFAPVEVEPDTFSVTVASQGNGTARATRINDSIQLSGPNGPTANVIEGTRVLFEAIANAGNTFARWVITGTNTTYKTDRVFEETITEDLNLTAVFELIPEEEPSPPVVEPTPPVVERLPTITPSLDNIEFTYKRGSNSFPVAQKFTMNNSSFVISYDIKLLVEEALFNVVPSQFRIPPQGSVEFRVSLKNEAINNFEDGTTDFNLQLEILEVS